MPTLASYEEETARVRRLTEENDALRQRLVSLQQRSSLAPEVLPPPELMDDFYIIAQSVEPHFLPLSKVNLCVMLSKYKYISICFQYFVTVIK